MTPDVPPPVPTRKEEMSDIDREIAKLIKKREKKKEKEKKKKRKRDQRSRTPERRSRSRERSYRKQKERRPSSSRTVANQI